MSDTPRTDAGAVPASNIANDCAQEWVTVNLARTLERELAAMTKARDNLEDIIRREAWLGHASAEAMPSPYVSWDAYAAVTTELAEVRERCERIREWASRCETEMQHQARMAMDARAERDAARAAKPSSAEPRNYTHTE